jgi:hypothetical protein
MGCTMRIDTDDHSQRLTAGQQQEVERGVRSFAARVAQDITQEGPAAWNKEFADSPSFFMASDGKLVFPDRPTATKMIPEVARAIPQIELRWGGDLRVDALTEDLAMVASSWHEVQVGKDGHRVEENGFFTGLAEKRNGKWQLRNAHWSSQVPAAKAP